MATGPHGYEALRRTSEDDLAAWIPQNWAQQPPPEQWWISVFDSLETEVMASLMRGESPQALVFVAALLEVAAGNWVARSLAALWALRFAGLVVRFDVPLAHVPDALTPNGSVRGALAAMPLAEHEAIAVARRRDALLSDPDAMPDPEIGALQDFESLMSGVQRIAAKVDDPELQGQLTAWLHVYERTAPGTS